MKRIASFGRLAIFLLAAISAKAVVCPTGFYELSDVLYNPIGQTPYTGTVTATLTYNTTTAGLTILSQTFDIPISNTGAIDVCLAPGFYALLQASTAGQSLNTQLVVPDFGGPYQLISVPSWTVNTSSTGNVVTAVTGDFRGVTVGDTVLIAGLPYTVQSITSASRLVTSTKFGAPALPTQTSVSFSDGPIQRQTFASPFPGTISGPQGDAGATTNGTLGQIMTSNGAGGFSTPYGPQGSDPKLLTSGTVSGIGSTLCTDAQLGATTVDCTGSGMIYPSAGVANSTGSAWSTSYSVTQAGVASSLLQLGSDSSASFAGATFVARTSLTTVQNSTADATTRWRVIPNGTSVTASVGVQNNSSATNNGTILMVINGATASILTAVNGSGTAPTSFSIGGSASLATINLVIANATAHSFTSSMATLAALTVSNLTTAGVTRVTTGGVFSSAELSGDATTSGSNAVTVKGINGTLLSGLATGLLKNTTTTGAPTIAVEGTDYNNRVLVSVTNTSTGTATNMMANSLGFTPGLWTPASANSIGVCVSGCGTTGTARIQVSGIAAVTFDNAVTQGHLAIPSTSVAGDLSDSGVTSVNLLAQATPVYGVIAETGAAGVRNVLLNSTALRTSGNRYPVTVSTLPATCTVGTSVFVTDAPAGGNIYPCSATNTWTAPLSPTTGTSGQVPTVNGTGGWGTSLSVTQVGAASSLVQTDSSGNVTATTTFQTSPWQLMTLPGSTSSMFFQSRTSDSATNLRVFPNGSGTSALFSLVNTSDTSLTNYSSFRMTINGNTAILQSSTTGSGTPVTTQNFGEISGPNALTSINWQFNGVTKHSMSPTMFTTSGLTIGTSTVAVGGNFTMSGGFTFTGTITGNTAITYPTSGTLFVSPMTTTGDIIYGGVSGAGTRLAAGTTSQVLIGGTTPSWGAVNLTTMVTGSLPNANLANSSITVATTAPLAGGALTPLGGTVTITCATCVTSAASLTNNAVVIGGGSQAASTISASTTTTQALFATAGAPAFRALANSDLPGTGSTTINGQTCTLASTCNVNVGSTAHTLALNQGNGSAITGAAAGTAKQILSSGGAGVDPSWIHFPDVKTIPFGAAPAGTAGSGLSYATGQWTPTARAGTNNIGAALQAIPNTGAVLQWRMELPLDWDPNSQPYVRVEYGSGALTSGTVIWTVASSCSKGDGSVGDDLSFNTESAFSTQTMASANKTWWSPNTSPGTQMTAVTSGNSCVPGGGIIIRLTLSGTATVNPINAYQATVTIPRLLTAGAN